MTSLLVPDWVASDDGAALLRALDAESGRTRLVGGAVRDRLLGVEGGDIDFATEFRPGEVIARLEDAGLKAVPTGLKHGTVTAVSGDLVAEVTTLRRDAETDGRHAEVDFVSDWREDAARRDFTINAMNARLPGGEVEDYFGGLSDLEAGIVRFIGDPLERIAEDHLRILRFFRFGMRFSKGEPDADALAACTARANDLMALSRERIAMELLRILAFHDPVETMRLMITKGIWEPVIPVFASGGVDRLERLVARERAVGVAPDPVRRLAALLPDPETAADVAKRLRLSNADRARLVAAYGWKRAEDTALPVRAHFEGSQAVRDGLLLADGWDAAAWQALAGWKKKALPLSGKHLIEKGLEPGPEVSRRLELLERSWAEAGFPEDQASLDALIADALA